MPLSTTRGIDGSIVRGAVRARRYAGIDNGQEISLVSEDKPLNLELSDQNTRISPRRRHKDGAKDR